MQREVSESLTTAVVLGVAMLGLGVGFAGGFLVFAASEAAKSCHYFPVTVLVDL